MGYSYNIIRKSKKKGMQIYKYAGVKVVFLNDYDNKRLLVFFYHEKTKKIHRLAMHFYYVRPIRKYITEVVRKIQEDDNYWEDVLVKRRSMSYKKEKAFKRYTYLIYKNSKK